MGWSENHFRWQDSNYSSTYIVFKIYFGKKISNYLRNRFGEISVLNLKFAFITNSKENRLLHLFFSDLDGKNSKISILSPMLKIATRIILQQIFLKYYNCWSIQSVLPEQKIHHSFQKKGKVTYQGLEVLSDFLLGAFDSLWRN